MDHYFLQTTAYARAHDDLFGSTIQQVVILITCENGDVQTFTSDVERWVPHLDARLRAYYDRAAAA